MKYDMQKDWQTINKMCRDLFWMMHTDEYKNYPELKIAYEKLKIVKDKLKKEIEN
jgi:hypothetical protein